MFKTETNVDDDPLYTKISHKSSITKPNLNQQPSMSHALALLFATACGMSVANIYFAQPLLDQLSNEFSINHSIIGIVITVTQIFMDWAYCYSYRLEIC